ncbi:MAG: type IV toxin-antitoxin system AbiEi family antitoxin domain-containing protein [Elusimicrobia bacterium]|nr:type IV toxin-antitoxin system AbiEi family antitoxin domain-containing protein [Elusimicrobiota bacterium]
MAKNTPFQKQLGIFKSHGGMMRTTQALGLGIHPRDLYAMKAAGVLEQISRGLYRASGLKPLANPDLITVALKIPKGIICLISALAFHEITTQIPHEVHVALPQGSEKPRLDHPPTRFAWFKEPAFGSGIETHNLDGVSVRVYCPEKTVADCFKARNKIGLDVAIEALKLCREKKRSSPEAILKYAKVCRVAKIMKPYLEAIL